ncbi:MAG TPA: TIGR01777 family oxidoreductase [Sphingobacteriaceae bacterium]
MAGTILITGGSGMIGKALTELLLEKGYSVNHLSQNPRESQLAGLKIFGWNVQEGTVDPACLNNVSAVIHLAGENISKKPWTRKRRDEIVSSRTKSIELIYQLLHKEPQHNVQTVISASASGYYGDRAEEVLTEESGPGEGFLSETTVAWESAVQQSEDLSLRIVCLRTGVVLDRSNGALPQLEKPIKAGFAAPLGSGKQWVPWIHIKDLARMYLFALETEHLKGAFNACAPQQITNEELTAAIRKHQGRSIPMPNVPAFLLRVVMGQMSEIVLASTRMSSYRIETSGFTFEFPTIQTALDDLYL